MYLLTCFVIFLRYEATQGDSCVDEEEPLYFKDVGQLLDIFST